ncbi:MAG: hypothetical protein IKH88_18245 [Prevotella sp.]|nr:hypothetical protein [Prevotella sp.]
MNKIHIGYIAIAALFMAACGNDEIEVVKNVSISYNVNTSSTYEPFGKENFETNYLSKGNNNQVGVFTYIYDKDGERVDSSFSHTLTFEPVQQNFNVKAGMYTIVTIETIVNGNLSYKSDFWSFVNTEKLATCQVRVKSDNTWVSEAGVLGISTKKIEVYGNQALNASPSPIGSIVYLSCKNFQNSTFTHIGFATHNKPVGVKLDPAINKDDRYVLDEYNKTKTWEMRYQAKMNKDDNDIFRIYLLEQGKIYWGIAPLQETGSQQFTFQDIFPSNSPDNTNEYILKDGGTCYAGIYWTGFLCEAFMGDSQKKLDDWYKNLVPSLFKNPCISWGATVSDVKSYMTFASLSYDIAPTGYGDYYMGYHALDNIGLRVDYQYFFNSDESDLTEVFVFLDTQNTYDMIIKHLTDWGFEYVGEGIVKERKYYKYELGNTVATIIIDYPYNNSKKNAIRYLPKTAAANVRAMGADSFERIPSFWANDAIRIQQSEYSE